MCWNDYILVHVRRVIIVSNLHESSTVTVLIQHLTTACHTHLINYYEGKVNTKSGSAECTKEDLVERGYRHH